MSYILIKDYPSTMLNGEDWGHCRLYLDIGSDGYPIRQMEFHSNGKKLSYSKTHVEDEFSVLSDACLDLEKHVFQGLEFVCIEEFDFEVLWNTASFDNSSKSAD